MFFRNNRSIFIVVVVGPDGVGKTTGINECKKNLIKNNYSFVSKHHVWGDLDEKPIYHTSERNVFIKRIPHKAKKNIIIKFLNYTIEKLNQIYAEIRYFIRLERMISEADQRNNVILIDRYIFDKVATKESREAFDIQYYLRRFLTAVMCKPDLCIMLSNSPIEIHKRKGELSLREAEIYLRSIKKLALKNALNFQEIETNETPESVGTKMYEAINFYNKDNKFLRKESARVIDLNELFCLLKDVMFVVTKTDVPYAVVNFPCEYPYGKDLDLVVSKADFRKSLVIIKKFAKQYKDSFSVKLIKEDQSRVRVRFLEANKLHYQIDISSSIKYADPDFTKKLIDTRKKVGEHYIPNTRYELWIRVIELKINNKKTHHLDYVAKNKSFLDYSLIENKMLKEYASHLLSKIS